VPEHLEGEDGDVLGILGLSSTQRFTSHLCLGIASTVLHLLVWDEHFFESFLLTSDTYSPRWKKSGNGDRASGALIGVLGVLEPIEQPCF